jgi:hypothetical protein
MVRRSLLCGVVGASFFGLCACGLLYDAGDLSAEFGRTADGGAEEDALGDSADAGPRADADARASADAPFCAAYGDAALCDDFDEGPLGGMWTSGVYDAGGTFVLSTAVTTSPPNALLVETPSTSTDRIGPHLRFDAPFVNVRLGFEMRLEAADPTGFYTLVAYESVPTTGSVWRMSIVGVGPELRLRVDTDGNPIEFPIAAASGLGTWKKIALHVRPRGASVAVEVDGAIVLSKAPPPPPSVTSAKIFFGVWIVRSTQVVRVRYDDVVIVDD